MSEWSKAGREGVRKIGRKEGRKVGSEGVCEQYSDLVSEWGGN